MQRTVLPSYPRAFYLANAMEIFERLAWYGFFTVSSVYMTTSVLAGGLGFTEGQRGLIQGLAPFFLYLLPVLTGAVADRFGYRRMFILSFLVLAPGYALLGLARGFWPFLGAYLLVALGAALFKPLVVGTVARSSDDTNRSLAFGIFYLMVNIGGFIGPIASGWVRGVSWPAVFALSTGSILVNLVLTLVFLRDLPNVPKGDARGVGAGLAAALADARAVLGNGRFALAATAPVLVLVAAGAGAMSVRTAALFCLAWAALQLLWDMVARRQVGSRWWSQPIRISNGRFLIYLLILSLFWMIYQQVFITLPLYIRDFADTSALMRLVASIAPGAEMQMGHVDLAGLTRALTQMGSPGEDPVRVLAGFQVRPPADEAARAIAAVRGGADAAAVAADWARRYRQINPEYLLALDFLAIVVGQFTVSTLASRYRALPVVLLGTAIIAGAFAWAGLAHAWAPTGLGVALVVVVFALGEMIASPKSQEYVAAIAPGESAAMYMGFYFVSMALGFLFAGLLSGWAYGHLALAMGRPDLMWFLFAGVGLATVAALAVFDMTQPQGLRETAQLTPRKSDA